jgi:hypothetical protein
VTNFACRSGRIPRCQAEPTTTLITGNVQSSEAAKILLAGATSVEGNVQLTGTGTGAGARGEGFEALSAAGGTVKGDVEIRGGVSFVGLFAETIDGNVDILNTSTPTGAEFTYMRVEEDIVGGNLEVGNNLVAGGHENELVVFNNSVAGNLRLYNNSLPVRAENGDFMGVGANHVGGNAELLDNAIRGLPMLVRGNAVTNILDCAGNKPPPTDFEEPNTAKKKLGQCELL